MPDFQQDCFTCRVPVEVSYKQTGIPHTVSRITECPKCHMRTFSHVGVAKLASLPTSKAIFCSQCHCKVTKIILVGNVWMCENCERAKR